MKKLVKLFVVLSFAAGSVSALAYDRTLADNYDKLFTVVKGEQTGKALNIMTPQAFVEKCKAHADMFAVDLRTPAETAIFELSLPDSIKIPVDQLFKPESLDRLPTNKPVILVCSSGTRSAAAVMALKHLGFNNVHVLKGGFRELSAYLEPKEANQALLKEEKQ